MITGQFDFSKQQAEFAFVATTKPETTEPEVDRPGINHVSAIIAAIFARRGIKLVEAQK